MIIPFNSHKNSEVDSNITFILLTDKKELQET